MEAGRPGSSESSRGRALVVAARSVRIGSGLLADAVAGGRVTREARRRTARHLRRDARVAEGRRTGCRDAEIAEGRRVASAPDAQLRRERGRQRGRVAGVDTTSVLGAIDVRCDAGGRELRSGDDRVEERAQEVEGRVDRLLGDVGDDCDELGRGAAVDVLSVAAVVGRVVHW